GILHHGHLGVGRPARRLALELHLLRERHERVDGEIDGLAAEEIAPVVTDVEEDVLLLLAERGFDVSLAPAGYLRRLDLGHLEGHARRGHCLAEILDHALPDGLVARTPASAAAAA